LSEEAAPMWQKILWIALAGAAGTLARFGLQAAVQRIGGFTFPWGTLAVNALGCLLFGIVWQLGEERLRISGEMRFIVLVGFMGAFTTFSTFAFETANLLRGAEWWLAAANFALQNTLGIALLFLGIAIGRQL
jgi:CrcB protein